MHTHAWNCYNKNTPLLDPAARDLNTAGSGTAIGWRACLSFHLSSYISAHLLLISTWMFCLLFFWGGTLCSSTNTFKIHSPITHQHIHTFIALHNFNQWVHTVVTTTPREQKRSPENHASAKNHSRERQSLAFREEGRPEGNLVFVC